MALMKSCVSETSKIIDLSDIVDKMDGSQQITLPFCIDDISAKIKICPNLLPETKGFCTVALYTINGKANDQRKFSFEIICGNKKCDSFFPVCQVQIFPKPFTIDKIKEHKKIFIRIQLNHNASCPKSSLSSFQQQLETMYQRAKQNGDVILIVKLNENNDLYIPQRKKRKICDETYKCCVCDQAFSNNKALETHQANKRDTAHKAYKNRNNCNGLDDDHLEIRMSSVILQSASKVFDRMLTVNMREKAEKKIEIMANNVKDVDDLLYFMCTNQLRSDYDAFGVLELADYYEMDRLRCHCINKLSACVSVNNFIQTVNVFDKYEISEQYESLLAFGKDNLEELKNKDNYDQLPHSVRCIMSSTK